MKKSALLFVHVFFFSLYAEQTIQTSSKQTPDSAVTNNFNIHFTNTHNSSNSNVATTTTTTSTNFNTKTIMSMLNKQWQSISFDDIKNKIEEIIGRSKELTQQAHRYCIHNKKTTALLIATIGYGYIFYQLYNGHYYLASKERWALWKKRIAFSALQELSQETISQDLLLEIQQRYLNVEHPTDFLTPLVLFLQAIDEEIKNTTYYYKLYARLRWCYCLKLFPINYSHLQVARERKERLLYLKHIVQWWIARHNIQANQK